MRKVPALLLALLIITVIFSVLYDFQKFADSPLQVKDTVRFVVPRGASLRQVARDLESVGALDRDDYFILLATLDQNAHRVQAGEYEISRGTTPRQLLEILVAGRVRQHAVTIVEGWTFPQLLNALHGHEAIAKTLEGPSDPRIMALIDDATKQPEGRFLPDTYYFPRGTTDIAFLGRAFEAMEREVGQAWAARADGLPLGSPYEVLILASIVEKEAARREERARIAGVFVRRLLRGMRLQSDPTVIYGLGERFDGNLRRQDLQADTSHNTYVRPGLPPTPIALPGRAAIWATVRPEEGESLYFVARGDGSHYFSATLAEHNRAVERFQLRGRAAFDASSP
jgi:UPF0755 protein